MATFVLIPGAGGSAWYWSRVVPLLEAAGHEAIAVDLPAEDPTAGLAAYVEQTVAAVGDRTDLTMVAQSLGAFTAAVAVHRLPVSALVLVNAMIPVPGETAGQWWEATGAIEARDAGGFGPFEPGRYFLHDVPAEVSADGAAHDHDEAEAVFGDPCDFDGWPPIPIRVLSGAEDRFFPAAFQRTVARDRLGLDIDLLAGGHLIALSQPAAVARYLLSERVGSG